MLVFRVLFSKLLLWNEAKEKKSGGRVFDFVEYFVSAINDCNHMHHEVVTSNPFAAKTLQRQARTMSRGQIFEITDDFATTKFFNSLLALVSFILSEDGRRNGWYVSETDLTRSSEYLMVHTTGGMNRLMDSANTIRKMQNGGTCVRLVINRVVGGFSQGLDIIVSGPLRRSFNALAVTATSGSLGANEARSLVKFLDSRHPLILGTIVSFPVNTKFFVPDFEALEVRRIQDLSKRAKS